VGPMPMPGAPPMGGAPPSPAGGGTGPAAAHGPMAGNAAQGMAKVKVGLEALQSALPMIPMGSELHTDLMKAVSSIAKHLPQGADQGGGAQIQQLLDLIRTAKTQGAPPPMGPAGSGGAPGALGAPLPPGMPPPPPAPAMLGA
jgi:hypothetical protein